MEINMNLYKVFYIVAQSKNFSDAALKLHVSAQSVSKDIKMLEEQLNTKLFYRDNKGAKLTMMGNKFFEYIDEMMQVEDLGIKMIKSGDDLATGKIVIGCPSHIAAFYLSSIIKKAYSDYPHLKINMINCANAEDMLNLLENHKIDFIIDSTQIEEKNIFNNIQIKNIRQIQNIFVSNKPLKIKDFKNQKCVIPYKNTSTTKDLQKCLSKKRLKLEDTMEVDSTEMRINIAKHGIGISYVMGEAVKKELSEKSLYKVDIPISLPNSKLNLIYINKNLTNIDEKFINEYLK